MIKQRVKTVAYRRISAVERRQQLIEAGMVCLGKGGMAAFTIDQICKQANVSRGLINHHFKSKDDLLGCIYEEMTRYLVADFRSNEPHQQLGEIIETSFDEKTFNRSNLRAWLSIWGMVATSASLNQLHRSRYDRYHARIALALGTILDCREPPASADSIARQLIALIDGLWLEYCLHSAGFSLAAAQLDCCRFLESHGVNIEIRNQQ